MDSCDSYCRNCFAFQPTQKCCNFIFIVGHSRGCPPGPGCNRRMTKAEFKKSPLNPQRAEPKPQPPKTESKAPKRRKPKNYRKASMNYLTPEEQERRMELYNKGYSDRQIGDAVGRKRSAIAAWRASQGLLPNYDNNHQLITRKPDAEVAT